MLIRPAKPEDAPAIADLAAACERRSPGQGLYLSVNQANHRAQAFYSALGASRTSESSP